MAHVVVADDSATARMIIVRCLEIAGCTECTIHEAANGQEALKLLITDLNMPIMSGGELLLRVKASPRLHGVRVLIISSIANPAKAQELLDQGADAVVDKPVSPEKIFRALEPFLQEECPHEL